MPQIRPGRDNSGKLSGPPAVPAAPEGVRIRRTRTLLRSALVELIEEKGFEKVTVGEIADRAMVSRAAFYRNYRDKYALVEQVFDDAMAALNGALADPAVAPAVRWTRFFEHLDEFHRLYGALLGRSGSAWFARRIQSSLAAMTAEHLSPGRRSNPAPKATHLGPEAAHLGPEAMHRGPGAAHLGLGAAHLGPEAAHLGPEAAHLGLEASILGALFLQAITWWLENGRPLPPEVIAARTAMMASAVIATVNHSR